MNDFKKKYYISNYKITKKNENGKRNENEMRRHVHGSFIVESTGKCKFSKNA